VEIPQETVDTIGNPVIDYLVNKLVDERTKELREEVERLRVVVKNLVRDL
jgi:hypothetical protein